MQQKKRKLIKHQSNNIFFILEEFKNIYEDIEFRPTAKGGHFIFYNGYKFVQHKKSINKAYFRCTQYNSSK